MSGWTIIIIYCLFLMVACLGFWWGWSERGKYEN